MKNIFGNFSIKNLTGGILNLTGFKNLLGFKPVRHLLGLTAILITLTFSSCESSDDDGASTPVSISKVYLEDAQSSVPDREVTFARLGQTIRLEGSGFVGLKKVYINGYESYFNPVYITDKSMLISLSRDIPTNDALPEVRNTIVLEKSATNRCVYQFDVRASAPSITDISHTLPAAGEMITVYGSGLQGITSVTFPGDVTVTSGIVSDEEDGEWFTVVVPQGVSNDGGSLLAVGANGGAYSPACFNYRKGIVHDFDNVQNYSWGSGVDNEALTATIPSGGGNLPKSQGGYQVFNSGGNLAAGADQRFWLNSSALMTIMGAIPASTPASDCGIQMDVFIDGVWNSGVIRFVMADGWGSSRYCMLYQPVYKDGAYSPDAFVNPGCWFTVTLPFSLSDDFDGKTLGDVINQMSAASYKQAGPWFENTGITDVFDPTPATERVYFDNIRFVPLTTPTYSDFPDE